MAPRATLGASRYFLLEPPHHVEPPHFTESVNAFLVAGYVPVITHPERLTWIEQNYTVFLDLAERGAWMQVTSGSLTGDFGAEARYWGERMVSEGYVHILATDTHGVSLAASRTRQGACRCCPAGGRGRGHAHGGGTARRYTCRPGTGNRGCTTGILGDRRTGRPWWKRLI